MKVLLLGANGSMGTRYQSILKYLKIEPYCVDVHNSLREVEEAAKGSHAIIIATPTDTHAHLIRKLAPLKKPILCEKPITKNIQELKDLRKEIEELKTPFKMMFQYEVLHDPLRIGHTYYNYFRHGSDGLAWDCLQIIGLARGSIQLEETSPIWQCKINGKVLNFAHMDSAYIAAVQRWMNYPFHDLGRLVAIHEKVVEYMNDPT